MPAWFTWWMASILANVAIGVVEYLNRTAGYANFGTAILHTLPFVAAAQLGLFYAWRDAPSFMIAWAVFTVGNSLLRMVNAQFFVGEPMSWATVAGISVMFGGVYLIKVGSMPA